MAIAADTTDLLSIWGQTLTIVRRSVTYGDTSKPTVTWSSQGTATGMIQPASEATPREEVGLKARATHVIYFPNGTGVLEGDRIRTASWASGDDEYEVQRVETQSPSHVRLITVLTKGHGG